MVKFLRFDSDSYALPSLTPQNRVAPWEIHIPLFGLLAGGMLTDFQACQAWRPLNRLLLSHDGHTTNVLLLLFLLDFVQIDQKVVLEVFLAISPWPRSKHLYQSRVFLALLVPNKQLFYSRHYGKFYQYPRLEIKTSTTLLSGQTIVVYIEFLAVQALVKLQPLATVL